MARRDKINMETEKGHGFWLDFDCASSVQFFFELYAINIRKCLAPTLDVEDREFYFFI